ncbi:squamous cell carcinoma antigen recognized by T-cells 3 [Ananas comosus]|uniref:Squamous cell carcinoma antigen recognized by T-cells 3 n=1 Tax=Ananas comosus TaxID=4615 RepID=A0A6P5EY80_ANACO|nr:squamous cell carcinoma antigen recognized by T-cells 3 [Ananas comosus]XP_020088463.1 squamous cell carcinoma antigen recognized by T-cells 3 [Ananas comosus]
MEIDGAEPNDAAEEEEAAAAAAAATAAAPGDETLGGAAAAAAAEDRNPSSPSSASSGGSESDEEEEEEEEEEGAEHLRIEALERSLREQPLDYEAHVKYIQCLRKSGQIEKLRAAREEMNKNFPLSPKMWQEWAKDEISLSASAESFTEVEKLYERAVQEYLSVPLWCDYANFVEEHDQSVSQCLPAGISKMRDLFERALTAAGLHIVEGSKIWEAYREYEQALFLTISDGNDEEKTKQSQRIRALFHRQLSIPLVDLISTLKDYKVWEAEQGNSNDINTDLDGVPSNVASAYQKAIEMYNARKQYEDRLVDPDTSEADKLQQFMSYIKFEESCGDPARVQVLYERAVVEFPVSSDLWLGYTSYLDRTLKVPTVLKSVYYRATRNCTWVSELWVRYLLSLERVHASEEEIRYVFELAVRCVFPSVKEYLELYLTRVDGLRRRISLNGEKDSAIDFQLIRQTFMDAADFLSPQLSTDDLLHLHEYWARLEANLGKEMVAARGVWENLIKKSGSMLEVWQHYIAMEIEMGHIQEARAIYKRCYSKRFSGTGSEVVCHSWLRFEREHGTLEDFDLAVKKVTPRLHELMIFKSQQESKTGSTYSITKDTHDARKSPLKRKTNQLSSNKQPPPKRRKEGTSKTVEASDVGPTKKLRNATENTEEVKKDDANAPTEQSKGSLKARDSKSNFYNDQCTAFVSNLNVAANEEHLREFFSDCGGVTAIRLLRDKFTGRSRGLAYVDFSDDEHLTAAIAKNKQTLLGKRLSVARSNPKQSHRKAHTDANLPRSRDKGVRFQSDEVGRAQENKKTVVEKPSSDLGLTGKNTFAAPRSLVKPLGWTKKEPKADGGGEELKSNEEFRNIFLKK